MTYIIATDGGCTDNQHPDKAVAYFSMRLAVKDNAHQSMPMTLDGRLHPQGIVRQTLPPLSRQTNQVAELVAMATALTYLTQLKERCQASGAVFPEFEVWNDSEYARGFAVGTNRKAKDNFPFVIQIQSLVKELGGLPITFIHKDDSVIKGILGH